jgi:hypothetical protein
MMGLSKARRWAKEDLDASDAEVSPAISPTPYLDVVRRGPQRKSPLPEATITGGTRGIATVESHAGVGASATTSVVGRTLAGRVPGEGGRSAAHARERESATNVRPPPDRHTHDGCPSAVSTFARH